MAPPKPLPDRSDATAALRARQKAKRDAEARAGTKLVHSVSIARRLDTDEEAVLLRLLSRTLHARTPTQKRVSTVYGRLRMTLALMPGTDTEVPTHCGILRLPGVRLTLASSERGPQ